MSENNRIKENRASRNYPMNGIRLCVDREGETIGGRFYSKMTDHPISFESTSNLLLEADHLFDRKGYPQRFMEPRSFREKTVTTSSFRYPEAKMTDEEIFDQEGKCHTLDVFVESRRKAGWQGTVFEPEGGFISEFKSELELLMILTQEIEKKPGKEG